MRQGVDGPAYEADIGAMTSAAQITVLNDQVADACSNRAQLLTGGRVQPGTSGFYEPTVLSGVDHDMRIVRDETFGPIVALMRVRDADEAVRLANDCDFGLSASIFCGTKRAAAMARRIEASAVNVNDVFTNSYVIDLPLGGWTTRCVPHPLGGEGAGALARGGRMCLGSGRQVSATRRRPVPIAELGTAEHARDVPRAGDPDRRPAPVSSPPPRHPAAPRR